MERWLPQWVQDNPPLSDLAHLGVLLAVAFAVYWIVRVWLVWGIRRLVARSKATWDDALVDAKLFARLAHIPPALVIYYGIEWIPNLEDGLAVLIQRVAVSLIVVVASTSLVAFLTAVNGVYESNPEYRRRPIKAYIQLVKIAIAVVTTIIVVSLLMDRSPWIFLSGLGAMTAVLLLVFRDTILSLVASIQIATNEMIHVGDWVEMPQAGVDGDVIEVALHTVKVQNWDKTISTIPTHKFIDESFKNWRGMSLSGGRRIKRSVCIDIRSVRFLTAEEIEKFGRWALLADYIAEKKAELERYDAESGGDARVEADIRRLTNIGTLRAYIVGYLRNHPKIHERDYTLMVRQLAPGPQGLPLELYCFSNDQEWTNYEAIQSDVFDHILAIVPEFGLRVFQSPTGHDVADLVSTAMPD
ncbi:MAG: mechanosensitive ion channel [Deltaproteobacteria bacterium]|nr:mechanosensitive ion channel [Deltaproteobacteria bacterium]